MLPQQNEYSLKDSVGYRLAELSGQMKAEMRRRVTKFGITTQQGAVLFALSRERDCNVTQHADNIGVDFGGTSRLVDRLESKGFVSVSPDGTDRRARRIELSQKGRQVAEKVLEASWETNRLFLRRVTQKEATQFREILDMLLIAPESVD